MKKEDNITPIVKKIIDKYDPLGLLESEAPKDEYNIEIQEIVAGLRMCRSIEDVQKLVYNVFKENFGEESVGNIDAYFKIACEIFEKIIKNRIISK